MPTTNIKVYNNGYRHKGISVMVNLLLIFLIVPLFMEGQTRFQKTKKNLSGDMLTFGLHRTYFLNSRFQDHLNRGIINPTSGFNFEWQYVFYPVSISVGYFSSGYKIRGYPSWQYENDTKVQHRGIELASNLFLLPDTYIVNPYIGLGYQTAAMGVGIEVLKEDGAKDNDISSVDMSHAIGKFGLLLSYEWLSLRGEYKRTIMIDSYKLNHQFSIGISFRQLYSKRSF